MRIFTRLYELRGRFFLQLRDRNTNYGFVFDKRHIFFMKQVGYLDPARRPIHEE